MATNQSWKLQDLQDLGLAEELQSGLYLSEFSSDNMKDIIQSLIDDEASDSFFSEGHPSQQFIYQEPSNVFLNSASAYSSVTQNEKNNIHCTLKVPTACAAKTDNFTVTYLNRGQSYPLCFSCHTPSESNIYKCVICLEFHDMRLRNSEDSQLQEWLQDHPGQRMVEIDIASCAGISNVQHPADSINSASFVLSSQQECTLMFRINCLSSEFTAKKHGGEKGAPFRLVVSIYPISSLDDTRGSILSKSFCVIKVFKDKGADRKHKQDLQKREKLLPEETDKYWQSSSVTELHPLQPTFDQKTLSPQFCSTPASTSQSPGASCNYSIVQATDCSTPHSTNQMPETCQSQLSPFFSVEETRQWLMNNRFTPYASLFVNYGGADLLRLSRKDVMDLCGPADGIRLYNAIHTRSVKRIYVSLEEDSTYHALFLETLSVKHLRDMLASKLSVSPSLITALHLQHTYGILVNVDDLCVRNMYDEQCFIMQPIKDENGTIQVILKTPTIANVSIPGLRSRTEQF